MGKVADQIADSPKGHSGPAANAGLTEISPSLSPRSKSRAISCKSELAPRARRDDSSYTGLGPVRELLSTKNAECRSPSSRICSSTKARPARSDPLLPHAQQHRYRSPQDKRTALSNCPSQS